MLLPALPAQAQTNRWSDDLVLPSPGGSRATPAQPQATAPTRAGPWSAPTYTRQRSAAENQVIVDRMVERARRDAREGRGAGLDHVQGRAAPTVPDKVWRDHIARDRANEAFQRNEDAYFAHQRRSLTPP